MSGCGYGINSVPSCLSNEDKIIDISEFSHIILLLILSGIRPRWTQSVTVTNCLVALWKIYITDWIVYEIIYKSFSNYCLLYPFPNEHLYQAYHQYQLMAKYQTALLLDAHQTRLSKKLTILHSEDQFFTQTHLIINIFHIYLLYLYSWNAWYL